MVVNYRWKESQSVYFAVEKCPQGCGKWGENWTYFLPVKQSTSTRSRIRAEVLWFPIVWVMLNVQSEMKEKVETLWGLTSQPASCHDPILVRPDIRLSETKWNTSRVLFANRVLCSNIGGCLKAQFPSPPPLWPV